MMRLHKTILQYVVIMAAFTHTAYANTYGAGGNDSLRQENRSVARANELTALVDERYGVEGSPLLRENYPDDRAYRADYLADGTGEAPNAYSYLWPFSGMLSAMSALFETTGDRRYLDMLDNRILPGLDHYYDDSRLPAGFASYVQSQEQSDRFYDDNIWLGIDFAELYLSSGEQKYLDRAKVIWEFVKSGEDSLLGGGIYWCEQKKTSKNTCSNAPAAVFAFRMFEASQDSMYVEAGKRWYDWTKHHLQDPEDGLYWDNINLDGRVDKRKYPYNSGQMLQSAALLYRFTQDSSYLRDAQRIAASSYQCFFEAFTPLGDESFRLLKRSDNWFVAVMMRGYAELHRIDGDKRYLNAFRQNLDYAWENARDSDGLFSKDWSGSEQASRKWLLDQAAMIEMYARIAAF